MRAINKLAIFGNGLLSGENLKEAKNYDYLIATDLASLKLINKGIIPDLAIGDFDSVSKKDLEFLKRQISNISAYPSEKNYTDLELAVNKAIKLKPGAIDIFGVTGTRVDHLLAAVFLLEKIVSSAISAKIIDRNNEIFLVKNSTSLLKSADYTFLSLIPLNQEVMVSIKGTKYELANKKINRGQTIGISNEITGKFCQITVHQGILIVIRSKD